MLNAYIVSEGLIQVIMGSLFTIEEREQIEGCKSVMIHWIPFISH